MQAWWENLSIRERWMLQFGGVLLSLLLIYIFAWSPFVESISAMRDQNQEQQELLLWMNQVVPEILQLRSVNTTQALTPDRLLSSVDQALQESALRSAVSDFQETSDNKIHLLFNSVAFDEMINWLQNLSKKYAIRIDQLSITPQKANGMVQADIYLKISK